MISDEKDKKFLEQKSGEMNTCLAEGKLKRS